MIIFHAHNEIDETKWDQCIASSTNPVIFARYRFLSVAAPDFGALIKGNYEAVMPLPCKKKYGVRYIYTPYFYSRLGIFSKIPPTAEDIQCFFNAIPRRYWRIDMTFHQNLSTILSDSNLRVSYQLKLKQPYSTIFQQYSNNHKRNIKASRKFQLHIDKNIPVGDIISLFKNNRGKNKMIKIKDFDYGFFLRLTEITRELNCLDVWGVRDDHDRLLAGGCFLHDNDRIWFWFSGRNEQYHEKRAMFFLLDEYIRIHAESPLILDFNGSMDENVARFYRGFGADKYNYPCTSRLSSPLLKPLFKIYQMIHY